MVDSSSLPHPNDKPWWKRLPILALLFGILSPIILLFTNFPPPEGVQSIYLIKIILYWGLSSITLVCLLYWVGDVIYHLFFAVNVGRAFAGFASILLIGFVAGIIYFFEGTDLGFFEEDAVMTRDASYRLISMGDSDGFPIHYALCECDKAAFQCVCHQIHTYVFGDVTADLTLNEPQNTITALFEDGLACMYKLPLTFEGQNASYSGYFYPDCR